MSKDTLQFSNTLHEAFKNYKKITSSQLLHVLQFFKDKKLEICASKNPVVKII